jgi:hypothetical protein
MSVNVNPFTAVLNSFGWVNSPTHEDYTWVYLLLRYGEAQYTANNETSADNNPFDEVLSRMSAYPGPAFSRLQKLVHSKRGG